MLLYYVSHGHLIRGEHATPATRGTLIANPSPLLNSRDSSVPPPAAATSREEMAARGGFQAAPTGGGGGAMGPGPPVPGAGPGMGPGTPSGRMGPSSAAQNHMYRSPMPGPGYPVR